MNRIICDNFQFSAMLDKDSTRSIPAPTLKFINDKDINNIDTYDKDCENIDNSYKKYTRSVN